MPNNFALFNAEGLFSKILRWIHLGRYVVFGLLFLATVPTRAHEFWIEPLDFKIASDEKIVASLRNGENFSGTNLPYLNHSFSQFFIYDQKTRRDISSRLGDIPAISENPDRDGLHVIVYESTDNTLKYESFEKFEHFALTEDVQWILSDHKARKLPEANVLEVFSRYTKALVASGTADGSDILFNLPIELLALSNPYMASTEVEFRLIFLGEPLPDTQIKVFHKLESSEATLELYRTDSKGEVFIDVSVPGSYLVNAVLVRRPSASKMLSSGAVWESLWASSTFGITH